MEFLEQNAATLAHYEPAIAQLGASTDAWHLYRVRSQERVTGQRHPGPCATNEWGSDPPAPPRPSSAAPAVSSHTVMPEEPPRPLATGLPDSVKQRMALRQGTKTNQQRLTYAHKCCEACGEELPPTSFICDSCSAVDRERATLSADDRSARAL